MTTPVQPLSTQGPSEEELARTADLDVFISDYFHAMSNDERAQCEQLLLDVGQVLKEWVRTVGAEQGLPADTINMGAAAHIYTSGSFRLGLLERGSDIDIVVVAPSHVTREHFFGQTTDSGLSFTLSNMSQVTKLVNISDAAVPILNFCYNGIEVDLGFASLEMSVIPETLDLDDDTLLRNVDIGARFALNGPRVTNLISKIAAPAGENFTKVLRSVRIWARRRAIYSNRTGYLGGVNWSILVAFTCQLYPNQTAAVLLQKFFFILMKWKWPNPITINEPPDPGYSGIKVWDATAAWREVMPILTPAYPVQNSSYSVSRSTLSIMQMEFERGYNLTNQAIACGGPEAWAQLFEPSDFFLRFNTYMMFTLTAQTEKNLQSWSGRFEARFRKLVVLLENHQPRGLFKTIFPHPKPVKVHENRLAEEGDVVLEYRYFLGFALDDSKRPKAGNLNINIEPWTENDVCNWPKKTEDMTLESQNCLWSHLPEYVFPEGREQAKNARQEKGYGKKKKKVKKRKADCLEPSTSNPGADGEGTAPEEGALATTAVNAAGAEK